MDFNTIDWGKMWQKEFSQVQWKDRASSKELWDKRAASFNKSVKPLKDTQNREKTDYISKMLDRIRVRPNWTVLDIGCGPGTLAIPLAQKAKRVTGLDVSSEMLKHLKQNAANSSLNNIDYINAPWQDAFRNGLVKPHDVVVASRSLMSVDMKEALTAMAATTRQAAYLTFPVMHLSFDWETYKAIGRTRKRHPPYIYILLMLYQMGIRANLEILESKIKLEFKSIDEAIEQISWRTDPFSKEEIIKLRKYLEDTFAPQKTSPPYIHHGKSLWALIWWEKENQPASI